MRWLAADVVNARRKSPANLEVYDYYLLAAELLIRMPTKETVARAQELLRKAIELDPQFARAYVRLGASYDLQASLGQGNPTTLFEQAKVTLLKAITLDPADPQAYALLGEVYCDLSDYDHGISALDQAFVLGPNDPYVLALSGAWLALVGRGNEGVERIRRAFRLNPHYPDWYNNCVDAFYATGQYDEVIAMTLRKRGEVLLWNQMLLAMSYAQLGRHAETQVAVGELLAALS